ncbi:hypothetical protein SCATT_54390 [Streptantibioticus cattleyicolor NRRL 8057 = DSM 46488]|uniref:Uncharacterized protein n=1 Tax=Streptantibioticus cattleyicolor (strain ATCC 35852 / DSM 46488 / JCM 4925 / NBRC 14057 / NRRL 8057) TaxID=1003195 RepID=G8WVQ4_STREN|nr:hypothetical protein SCATT_54390 [Streptantibioticus cattleyicolor NRRL 8057 = DSM 46488]
MDRPGDRRRGNGWPPWAAPVTCRPRGALSPVVRAAAVAHWCHDERRS